MTERYEKYTRAQLNVRLHAEREALYRSASTDAERLAHECAIRQLELEIENRHLHAASESMQDVRNLLAEASEQAPEGTLYLDADARISDPDSAAAAILGGTAEALVGRALGALVHSEDQPKLRRHLDLLRAGNRPDALELRLLVDGGDAICVRMACTPAGTPSDPDRLCAVHLVDITQQRRVEADARRRIGAITRAARLNALAEMASGIAHELSQPLSAIMAYARAGRHLLQQGGPEARAELEQSLDKVMQQAERAGEIIRRIRGSVHKAPPKFQLQAVGDLLRHALAVLDDDIQEGNIAVRVEDTAPEMKAWVDAIFVEQVMVNILRNAVESISAAGGDVREIVVRISQKSPEWLEVSITDTGEGLVGQDPEQWFMPFATSRRGSLGLSLSLSRSLVEAHGGHLWAEPAPAGGAILRFTLPTESAR